MALPLLAPVVLAIICLGVAAALTVLTLAAINVLKNAPVVGGWLADKAAALEQSISHALGAAFAGIDAFIGGAIHHLAMYANELWREIRGYAHLIAREADALAHIAGRFHNVHGITNRLVEAFHGIEHGVHDLTRKWHGIERRVKAIEHEIARGIGHDLITRLREFERALTHVTSEVIPGLRTAERDTQAALDNLYEWAKGKASLLGIGTFATAVAAAIGLEAFNLLRCGFLRNLWGKRGCGLWQGLEDILGLFFDGLLLTHLCDLPAWINEIFGPIEGDVVSLVSSAAGAVCAGPPQGWPVMPDRVLQLPTAAELTNARA